jgi:probable HAF family extracellular repeat protein
MVMILGGVLAVIGSPVVGNSAMSFKPVPFLARGINDRGQIVGFGGTHGYVLGGKLVQFDVPGATDTALFAINRDGDIVGSFETDARHGLLLKDQQITVIDVPGAVTTQATGINDRGQIVGTYTDVSGLHGFQLSDGAFTTLDYPGAHITFASKINNTGTVVGGFNDAADNGHGYVLKDGEFTALDFPGATFTQAFGVNDDGDVVGEIARGPFGLQGFLYSGGAFAPIELPCLSFAAGINNKRQIVGDCGGSAGFLLNGKFLLDQPGK